MKDNFPACLAFTLHEEGGWADNPSDVPTMCGITLSTYQQYMGNDALTADDLKVISQATIQAIYMQNYWTPTASENLPAGVDLMVFDAGVNMGVHGSIELLQRVLNISDDGIIGPVTLATVSKQVTTLLIDRLFVAQSAFYHKLPKFPVFGTGWLNRVNARKIAALKMAGVT